MPTQSDVISSVKWSMNMIDDVEDYGKSVYMTTDFDPTIDSTFISFGNITEQDLIYWIEEKENISTVKCNVRKIFHDCYYGLTKSKPLPWTEKGVSK